MPALFILDVATDSTARRATLRLRAGDGAPIETHEVALDEHAPSLWSGLFDTRQHVTRMKDVTPPKAQLAALGQFLGEHVLGPAIAGKLAEGMDVRTLLVRLPAATDDALAVSFAQVPWELAMAPGDDRTLLDRHVMVRAAPAGATPAREMSIELAPGERMRVLLVFAEAPGAPPYAARFARERLLKLFFDDVLPWYDVEVDVLCHDVTRTRLVDQVRSRAGYHLVHWSGRGQVDGLQIAPEDGEDGAGWISGRDLVKLFERAGGFIPQVMFLGACDSGALGTMTDRGPVPPSLRLPTEEDLNFTGTALSLVRAGVKQVVAMRYEVGDRYARRLARRFYRGLLAEKAHHPVDSALALARRELANDTSRAGEYNPVDHANPLVFGGAPVQFEPRPGRSTQLERRAPKPQPLLRSRSKELDPPQVFVGRRRELTELLRWWLAPSGAPIAVLQGLAGLGKTSLAAEAIHLWHGAFQYVLCFQAKGGSLSIEEVYQQIDQRLVVASPSYLQRCQERPMGRLRLDAGPVLDGEARAEALRNNLVEVLVNERILLVLDNFEANLLGSASGPEGYAAQDPAWDRLLEVLGERLQGSGARVLITSRHKVAAVASEQQAVWVPLGPLPAGEALLVFEGHPPLRELLYGDEEAKALAARILDVSRGHPLILGRIADLARGHCDGKQHLTREGRRALGKVLHKLQGEGFKVLPDVFVGAKTDDERERERAYLEDVAIGAVDILIERLSARARTLLWVVTRAGEPVAQDMIAGVWSEPPLALLDELCGSGLLVRDGDIYAFHELVAERAAAWVSQNPDERGSRTEAEVWTAYGTQYSASFRTLVASAKRDLASEAGRRGIRYLVRAGAFGRLEDFASSVVTGTHDPELLAGFITDLEAAAGQVPTGKTRWMLQTCLADALRRDGRLDQALLLYKNAANAAEAANQWKDVGWICGNWSDALVNVGQLNHARETIVKSTHAMLRTGWPRVDVIHSEIKALRIDVLLGRAETVYPTIEAKLDEVRRWSASRKRGERVPEAPDDETLTGALISGLSTAFQASLALERWQICLDLLKEIDDTQRDRGDDDLEVARARFNRYGPLIRLGSFDDAKTLLHDCLEVFHRRKDLANEARALGALADVWNALRDPAQAISLTRKSLAVCECLPDPRVRAILHNNLASYLSTAGSTGEAKTHHLAALIYSIASGLDPHDSLDNLAIYVRQSAARGETFALDPVVDLLANPTLVPLRAFLAKRGIAMDELQTAVDYLVAQVQAAV